MLAFKPLVQSEMLRHIPKEGIKHIIIQRAAGFVHTEISAFDLAHQISHLSLTTTTPLPPCHNVSKTTALEEGKVSTESG